MSTVFVRSERIADGSLSLSGPNYLRTKTVQHNLERRAWRTSQQRQKLTGEKSKRPHARREMLTLCRMPNLRHEPHKNLLLS